MSKSNSTRARTDAQKSLIFDPRQWFFDSEVSAAILLLLASLCAVFWANSVAAKSYMDLLNTEISLFFGNFRISHSLRYWINDGLMTLFFFTVGLEIKREVLVGELASIKKAMLPIFAAAGGMVLPAGIYLALNHGTTGAAGWGVPMATDIAFSLGAIAIIGRGLPVGLRIFLTAFAIADDLGAVIIIAVFYTQHISWNYVLVATLLLLCLCLANRLATQSLPVYIFLGSGAWIAAMGSGIHPTIAGVLVALLIPAQGRYPTRQFVAEVNTIMDDFQCHDTTCDDMNNILLNSGHLTAVHSLELACHHVETPLQRLEHALHPFVVFIILPLFALGNAGLSMKGMTVSGSIGHPVALGIILGLFVGKPVGITLFSYIAVRSGIASLPEEVAWVHVIGAGLLGGIGFTMSLFISGLAFASPELLNFSKLGILLGSILSLIAGSLLLVWRGKKKNDTQFF
jgi:NhaA family Na+:H+ antiporter